MMQQLAALATSLKKHEKILNISGRKQLKNAIKCNKIEKENVCTIREKYPRRSVVLAVPNGIAGICFSNKRRQIPGM